MRIETDVTVELHAYVLPENGDDDAVPSAHVIEASELVQALDAIADVEHVAVYVVSDARQACERLSRRRDVASLYASDALALYAARESAWRVLPSADAARR